MVSCRFMQAAPSQVRIRSSARVLGLITAGLLIGVLLLSGGSHWWDVDLAFSRVWWHSPHEWFGDRSGVCWFLNEYGAWPGVLLVITRSAVSCGSSPYRSALKTWRSVNDPIPVVVSGVRFAG